MVISVSSATLVATQLDQLLQSMAGLVVASRWNMTQTQLSKMWLIVSALLLYYALNSWIVAQGGNEVFGAKLVVSNKIPAAMIAIPICAILLLVASLIGRLFALRGRPRWHERLPFVGFDSIDTASSEGRRSSEKIMTIAAVQPSGT
jgi:hypothetical protein